MTLTFDGNRCVLHHSSLALCWDLKVSLLLELRFVLLTFWSLCEQDGKLSLSSANMCI